ncbi:hypothetical protein ACTXT7_015283 [Hymenolepis weldensis]
MQITLLKFNSANVSTQTHDRGTHQPDTLEFSMENRDNKFRLTSNEQNATKTLPLSSMQREKTMKNGPPIILESNSDSGLTPFTPVENTNVNHSFHQLNGSAPHSNASQVLSNFVANTPVTHILDISCNPDPSLPFPLILEQFLLLQMPLNISRSNLGANNPLTHNLLNTPFNPSISLPSRLSSERTKPLHFVANATKFAPVSATFNPNSSAGPQLGTLDTSGSRPNDETLNQGAISTEGESIVQLRDHSSRTPGNRKFPKRRAKRPTQYSCNICHESFHRAKDLDVHTKAVHGKYQCQKCGARITQRSNLTRHEPLHSRQRPYACCFCSKAYCRQDHLKRHIDHKHSDRCR